MKESLAQEYRHSEHWFFRARRSIFQRFLAGNLSLSPGARVLDLGPGSGVNVPILTPLGRLAIVDISRMSLEDCRDKGATDLCLADARHPPFADDSFDLVCALDVIEHLKDDAGALAECHRVLRPDGRFLVSVPAWMLLWGRQDVLSEHYRRYRRKELRDLLEEAGFEIERLSYFNFLLFAPILVVRLLMRPFLSSTGKGGSDLTTPTPLGLDRLLYGIFTSEAGWLARRNLPIGVSLIALARPKRG